MNKILLFIPILLLSIGGFAQQEHAKKDKIKELKTTFIADRLTLTAEESEKFWPVYNDYNDKQFDLQHIKMKKLTAKLKDGSAENMSEKEAAAFLIQLETIENELYQNKKKLASDLKAILSSTKIIKLKKAEDEFNRKLLKQYHNKKAK